MKAVYEELISSNNTPIRIVKTRTGREWYVGRIDQFGNHYFELVATMTESHFREVINLVKTGKVDSILRSFKLK